MKSSAGMSAGIVSITFLFLCLLLWSRPFDQLNSTMDAVVHAAPKWSQVENLYIDPHTQETTHGSDPQTSLGKLEQDWQTESSVPKVFFIGNSQMLAMSLAPGESASTAPERTYVDLLARDSRSALLYRLAAPGMSYEEALWYLEYLLCHPALQPSAVVLQINYQAFWTGGIRQSLDSLLDDGCFRSRAHDIAGSHQPFADDFTEAEKNYARAKKASASTAQPFGTSLEDAFASQLQKTALFRDGLAQRDDFAQMLYRLRLYVLQVKPSTARSVTGPRLTKSQTALEQLVQLCESSGIRLVIFSAPVNPAVSLYSSETDRANFQGFVRDLVTRHALPYFDFEHAIEAKYWGRQFNSADPLHIGRRGHEIFAADMRPVVRAATGESE